MSLDLNALDGLLSKSLDEIADLPDYKTPPAGIYKFKLHKLESKSINEQPALAFTYEIVSVLQLVDAETEEKDQVIPGNMFSMAYFFGKVENFEQTLGALKRLVAPLAEISGTTNLKEILVFMEANLELIYQAEISNRIDKKVAPPKIYPGIKELSIATS